MRKTITLLTFLLMQVSFAQIDCPDFTPDNSGNSFYPPEGSTIVGDYIQLPIGMVDQIYGENIQFFTPDHQLELDGTSFQFDSIQIDDIYFLPNGIDYQCSTDNCIFYKIRVLVFSFLELQKKMGFLHQGLEVRFS